MTLPRFPPEILLHIFNDLGPEFFHQDIGRLSVSKWWYHDYAWPTLVKHLKLSSMPFKTPRWGKPRDSLMAFSQNDSLVLRAQPHTSTLSLTLANFDPHSIYQYKHDAVEAEADFQGWVAETKSSMAKLVAKLAAKQGQRPRLQHLNVNLWVRDGWYPLAEPLSDLLLGLHLTSLHFNAAGSAQTLGNYGRRAQQDDSGIHFCPVINGLFPTLRRLRCSIDFICELLLEPPAECIVLDLEEVIISLTRAERIHPDPILEFWVNPCQSPPSNTYNLLRKGEVQGWATALVSRLENPRMVRVIWVETPRFHARYHFNTTHAFDAVRGERLLLRGSKWDAEGEVLR
jgi:hypothetical protein